MKKLLLSILTACLFASCSKTQSDFIGDYKTKSIEIAKVEDRSTWSLYGRMMSKSFKCYVLSDVDLEIFEEATTGETTGQLRYMHYSTGYTSKPSIKEISFKLESFRLKGDTLFFELKNDMLSLTGQSMRGLLLKNADTTILGLSKKMTGSNKYTEKNPYFLAEKEDFLLYSCTPNPTLEKEFYENELSTLKEGMEKATNKYYKAEYQNAIDYIKNK